MEQFYKFYGGDYWYSLVTVGMEVRINDVKDIIVTKKLIEVLPELFEPITYDLDYYKRSAEITSKELSKEDCNKLLKVVNYNLNSGFEDSKENWLITNQNDKFIPVRIDNTDVLNKDLLFKKEDLARIAIYILKDYLTKIIPK